MSNDPYQAQESPSEQPLYEFATNNGYPIAYGQPPAPYPPQSLPKARGRLWVILSIIGIVLILLLCGSCVAASVFGVRYIEENFGSTLVVTQYYQALKEQKYDLAYSYVEAGATIGNQQHITLATFTRLARAADRAEGKVVRATPANFTQTNGNATVTMQVMRSHQTYRVTLHLKKEGNDWQISSANTI